MLQGQPELPVLSHDINAVCELPEIRLVRDTLQQLYRYLGGQC